MSFDGDFSADGVQLIDDMGLSGGGGNGLAHDTLATKLSRIAEVAAGTRRPGKSTQEGKTFVSAVTGSTLALPSSSSRLDDELFF